jgi:hypothetical protein
MVRILIAVLAAAAISVTVCIYRSTVPTADPATTATVRQLQNVPTASEAIQYH